ncbi:hypothetical protein L9F63_014885, partial [Diploptera punctata]
LVRIELSIIGFFIMTCAIPILFSVLLLESKIKNLSTISSFPPFDLLARTNISPYASRYRTINLQWGFSIKCYSTMNDLQKIEKCKSINTLKFVHRMQIHEKELSCNLESITATWNDFKMYLFHRRFHILDVFHHLPTHTCSTKTLEGNEFLFLLTHGVQLPLASNETIQLLCLSFLINIYLAYNQKLFKGS